MTENFTADCDHCGDEFDSDDPVWDDYEELHTTYDNLMLVLNPCGYHPPWFCSRHCQLEATREARQEITDNYGTTCTHCDAKIGECRIRPCDECDKLVCKGCEVHDDSIGVYCSNECRDAKKRCLNCNRRIPKNKEGSIWIDGDLCEGCASRRRN